MLGQAKQIGTSSDRSIISSWSWAHSSPRVTGRGLVGKAGAWRCWHRGALGGSEGRPFLSPLPSTAWDRMKWGKVECKGPETHLSTPQPHPNLGQENRPWDLQARKGGPRITARLDLNAAPKEQRRLCVITSCFALAHPPRTASPGNPAGYRDMGGSAEDINRNSIVCPVSLHTWAGCLLNNFLAAAELKSWAGRWRGWLAFMSQECARLDSTADRCRTEACSPKRLA